MNNEKLEKNKVKIRERIEWKAFPQSTLEIKKFNYFFQKEFKRIEKKLKKGTLKELNELMDVGEIICSFNDWREEFNNRREMEKIPFYYRKKKKTNSSKKYLVQAVLEEIRNGEKEIDISPNTTSVLSRLGYHGYLVESHRQYGYTYIDRRWLYIPTKKIRKRMEKIFQNLVDSINEIEYISADTNRAKALADAVGISEMEAIEVIDNNKRTGGTAWKLLDNIGDNGYTYDDVYRMMSVAHRRHTQTDYDEIDKSRMSDEQVAILRKSYN